MKYKEFVKKVRDSTYFKIETLRTLPGDNRTLKNQMVLWQRQGNVHRLRNGIYTLNDEERRVPLPRMMISNLLCAPSYVSLESALAYYGLIPERVTAVTAVTTLKTATYRNFYGPFVYRSLKESRFFGFDSVEEERLPVLVAMPEKALLDKIYFDPAYQSREDYFVDGLRLQNHEGLNITRLLQYARRFRSGKVREGAAVLVSLIRSERR